MPVWGDTGMKQVLQQKPPMAFLSLHLGEAPGISLINSFLRKLFPFDFCNQQIEF